MTLRDRRLRHELFPAIERLARFYEKPSSTSASLAPYVIKLVAQPRRAGLLENGRVLCNNRFGACEKRSREIAPGEKEAGVQ